MTIPIVFSTNNAYAPYCYVAVSSLINHISSDNVYEIYVMKTELEETHIRNLEALSKGKVRVQCIDITAYCRNVVLQGYRYLSVEAYYRLFIPLVFPQYEKVMYLDSDICVMGDVAELYKEELSGYAIGAVKEEPTTNVRTHCVELGIPDYTKAFNTGILLIDTVCFEKTEIRRKALEVLQKDYKNKKKLLVWADQDALNIILNGQVAWLPAKWNCQTRFLSRIQTLEEPERSTYAQRMEHALIYHYASPDKLWFHPENRYAKPFWNTAKNTPYFEKIFHETVRRAQTLPFEKYHFPYDKVPFGSRIVLYGAGKIGQTFYRQLELTGYAKVVLWVDKGWRELKGNSFEVVSPTEIMKTEYDLLFIAVEKDIIAKEIIEKLVLMKVQKEKIVYTEYIENETKGETYPEK